MLSDLAEHTPWLRFLVDSHLTPHHINHTIFRCFMEEQGSALMEAS